ncbi:BLUE COPPER PROTEIN [Salix viminalis]|uniref:BLUE COPPER PROTEIN n=1 Tax=Salix viminalis TaxID=40686 RepID=A0A9Q0SDR8_SALVM|nr:BLUE COPPER PROTEIN [Salix viminalis]
MARVYGMALLAAAISVAYLIHSSSAQTTYTVGDTTGWTVPQKVGRKMIFDPGAGADLANGARAGEDAREAAKEAAKTAAEKGAEKGVDQAKSSATSLGFAGFTTFLSIFVALCY